MIAKSVANTSNDVDFAWIERVFKDKDYSLSDKMFPLNVANEARSFHKTLPGYSTTPLVSLKKLAERLNVKDIWVKDESKRLELGSFKVVGGSFAVYRLIQRKLGMEGKQLTFDYLSSSECKKKLGNITFASATDGNHGRGLAWIANKLGYKCVIYVHSLTSQPRIDAIAKYGATVKVIKGNYDNAVRQCGIDAEKNGWEVVSDTSWEGYTEIPTWIMQGYNTIFLEANEQMKQYGADAPTHIFVQAGVGALAASTIGFYSSLYKNKSPKFIVVEPSEAACIYESALVNDDKPHTVEGDLDTIMAGLACGEPSPIAWNLLSNVADGFVKVPDFVAARGMRILRAPLDGDKEVISGESGSVGLGALYSIMAQNAKSAKDFRKTYGLDKNSRILFINTEGNTDPVNYQNVVWEGYKSTPDKFITSLC